MDTATPSGTEVEPGTPSSGNMYTASDDMQTCEDDHTGTGYSDEDSEAETDSTQRQQAEEIGHLLKENLSAVSIIHCNSFFPGTLDCFEGFKTIVSVQKDSLAVFTILRVVLFSHLILLSELLEAPLPRRGSRLAQTKALP